MESGGSELSTRGWASGDDFFIVLVIDLVFLVTLSDCDWPVFFSNPLKNIRNKENRQRTHGISTPLPRVLSHAYFKGRCSGIGGRSIFDDVFLPLLPYYTMSVEF